MTSRARAFRPSTWLTSALLFAACTSPTAGAPPSAPPAPPSTRPAPAPPRPGDAGAPALASAPNASPVVRVGMGETVTVAPGQQVEGLWFRAAVMGHRRCGDAPEGYTWESIDVLFDNLSSAPVSFFTDRAIAELDDERGGAFPIDGGDLPAGPACSPSLVLRRPAPPARRLRGWPFAPVPTGHTIRRARFVFEEPHGFATSTVQVDFSLPAVQPAALPAAPSADAAGDRSDGAAEGDRYFTLTANPLRVCTSDEPWIKMRQRPARPSEPPARVVGVDLRLVNAMRGPATLVSHAILDAEGRAYTLYPATHASCGLGEFPESVPAGSTGQGVDAIAIVPAGLERLRVKVSVGRADRNPLLGYPRLERILDLGDGPP